MSLVIRADASVAAGTGHLMRCLALAQAWREAKGPVCFVSSLDSPRLERRLEREAMVAHAAAAPAGGAADVRRTVEVARQAGAAWVVVDGYHLPPAYRAALRQAGLRLLLIDDNGDCGPYDAELVVNQNAHARPELYSGHGPSTRLLLGPAYALLRQELLGAATRRPRVAPRARRLLITMGGADAGNATLRVMAALRRLREQGLECEAILGAANPHRASLEGESRALGPPVRLVQDPADLAQRMARADAAVSAGGVTLLELCYFGVPTLAVSLAANQRAAVARLSADGALVDGTAAWAESSAAFASSLTALVADGELRASLAATARRLVDGRGAARVVAAMREHGVGP